ncbi:MAG: hypothetical protein JWM32_963 [Verrucomicrobia bacterium]|nr:hypothetical protein [Verrucomicrobiota bacterium]
MNRKILVVIVAVIVAAGLFFGYRAYKASADRQLAQQRAEAQLALIKEHEAELARRTAAILEARRMAEARAKDELARQEKLRQEQAEAQAALDAAQAEITRLNDEAARLAAERNATTAESARLAVERQRAADAANAARLAALQKLRDLDQKRAETDRETARLAALLRQQELEAEAQRLALEHERQSFEVGGYLVRDFRSVYILKEKKPVGADAKTATPPASEPANAEPSK